MGGHLAVLLASDGSSRLQIAGPDGAARDVAPPAGAALAIAAGPDGRLTNHVASAHEHSFSRHGTPRWLPQGT